MQIHQTQPIWNHGYISLCHSSRITSASRSVYSVSMAFLSADPNGLLGFIRKANGCLNNKSLPTPNKRTVLFIFHMYSNYSNGASFTCLAPQLSLPCCSSTGLIDRLSVVMCLPVQPSCHSGGCWTSSPSSSHWTRGDSSPSQQATCTSPRWTRRTAATTPVSSQAPQSPRVSSPSSSPWFPWLNVSTEDLTSCLHLDIYILLLTFYFILNFKLSSINRDTSLFHYFLQIQISIGKSRD